MKQDKITVILTKDEAKELLEAVKEKVGIDFTDLFNPNAKPSKTKENASRLRLIKKLKKEMMI